MSLDVVIWHCLHSECRVLSSTLGGWPMLKILMRLLVCFIASLCWGKWEGDFLYKVPVPFLSLCFPQSKQRVSSELDYFVWICSGACQWDWFWLHGICEAEVRSIPVEEGRTAEVMLLLGLGNLLIRSGIKSGTCVTHVQAKIWPR